jgi:hypothetical protein
MPDWLLAVVSLVVLVGFIGFAFMQGFRVRPDKNNSDNQYPGGLSGDGHGL